MSKKEPIWKRAVQEIKQYKGLYLMLLPVLAFYFIFHYMPIYGVQIAFKDFVPKLGITNSPWVGLKHFIAFFESIYVKRLIRNTVLLNLYNLIFGFPIPILFAILLNELSGKFFRKTVQTISYLPHFVSTVVIAGIIIDFTATEGVISTFLNQFLAIPKQNLLMVPEYFRTIYVSTDIWQGMGWSSIIYLAALANIDLELIEAATIDGAGRFRRIIHIILPCIAPTIVTMLILQIGNMFSLGFEKVFLLYNPGIYETADIISTFVYRKGLQDMNFSYSTAVNMFNSAINMLLLVLANTISKKFTDNSLW